MTPFALLGLCNLHGTLQQCRPQLGSQQYLLDNSLPPKESKLKHNTSINGFFAAIENKRA